MILVSAFASSEAEKLATLCLSFDLEARCDSWLSEEDKARMAPCLKVNIQINGLTKFAEPYCRLDTLLIQGTKAFNNFEAETTSVKEALREMQKLTGSSLDEHYKSILEQAKGDREVMANRVCVKAREMGLILR